MDIEKKISEFDEKEVNKVRYTVDEVDRPRIRPSKAIRKGCHRSRGERRLNQLAGLWMLKAARLRPVKEKARG